MTTDAKFDPKARPRGYAINPTPPNPKATHRTRFNAYKHGLTGQIHLLTEAEKQAFDTHCEGIVAALAPVGALEVDLAQTIAEGRWRLKRVCVIEAGIFADGHRDAMLSPRETAEQLAADEATAQARTWLFKADKFQLLVLYEQRINRTVERNMAELRTLQAVRHAAHRQALEEARVLAQHAQSKGETYEPARDFPPELLLADSVFSAAAIARNQRLTDAQNYSKSLIKNPPNTKMRAAA